MSKDFLTDAFKQLDLLNEEVFSFDNKGISKLKSFMDDEAFNDVEPIIDPEAETEEDLQDDYVGKALCSCSVCHSYIFKDPSDIKIDEETQLVNVDEECPYCHTIGGYKVIGQIDEFKFDEDDKAVESEGESADELAESVSKRDDIDAEADDKKEKAEKAFTKAEDDADADRDYRLKKADLEESDKPAATSIEDAQKWVDYDMEKYHRISDKTNDLVKKAGFQIVKDKYGDYEVIAGKYDESLKEDFQKVEIETDTEKMSMTSDEDGKTTVTTEPKTDAECEECGEDKEVIAPVSDELKAEIEADSEEETTEVEPEEEPTDEEEVDIEEFDEEGFDELGESYLKEVYDNVKSYKTISGKVVDNKLMLEGVIEFNSGKKAKTNFIFESKYMTKKGKLKFLGENLQFSNRKKAFILTASLKDKKLINESFTYNYVAEDANTGKTTKLYGTVKRK